jgi:hypothetical protein
MEKNERIAFKYRVDAMKRWPYHMYDKDGALITDHSLLGEPVQTLIRCLHPKTPSSEQKNQELMAQRYHDTSLW